MFFSKVHLLRRVLQLLFLMRVAIADTLTVTITAYPNFLSQRSCAVYCYVNAFDGQYYDMGCPTPVENSCYCRDDLIPSMVSSLSTCVSASCSGNSDDVYSATSIYEGYCSSNGYVSTTATATVVESGEQTQSATTGQGVVASPTLYSSASSPSSSSSSSPNSQNNNGSGGLSTGAIAAIGVVGSLAGIVSAVVAVYVCCFRNGGQ